MIDTMLYFADIPAGTYAIGDKVTFTLHSGPAVVRDGLGAPVLKSINTGGFIKDSTAQMPVRYKIKNSNWNDPIYNGPSHFNDVNFLSEASTGFQNGNDCVLQVNSSFEVEAEFYQALTSTGDNSAFVGIDIEYSGLPGVQDPRGEKGEPCSLVYDLGAVTATNVGAFTTATWSEASFDTFKAGYRYLMQKMSLQASTGNAYGFIKFSGGASMGGLARIIPFTTASAAVGKIISYTSPEVKGPFNIGVMYFGTSSSLSATVDYVKRG